MKKFAILIIGIIMSVTLMAGEFTGVLVDNSFMYLFRNEQGKEMEFDFYDKDVKVDLDSEEMIGKKMKIEYKVETIEVTDEEGQPTGDTDKSYIIVAVTVLQ